MSHSATLDATTPSDAELIAQVRGGDVHAYGELFERHRDAAQRLARQMAGQSDAEDLVSDAFAKVLNVLMGGGGPDVAFRAYLLTAVRRLHIDRIRAVQRVQPSDEMEKFDPGLPFQDPAVEKFEGSAAARAFASLPERWQLVLWHLEVEGQKPADVGPLLGLTANSVSALAYRAREGLRQAYLQMHMADTAGETCRWTTERLGAHVRKGLSRRDANKVDEHLDECARCSAVYLELVEVNSNLRGILAPLLLGSAATGYLASTTGGLATGGVFGWFLKGIGTAKHHAALTTGGAAATTAAVVGLVIAATNGPDQKDHTQIASDPLSSPVTSALVPTSSEPTVAQPPRRTTTAAAAPVTRAPVTSAPVTSAPVSSVPPTSAPRATVPPTTAPPTTQPPTTQPPTTRPPTTQPPATRPPTTQPPTTQPPSTRPPTTQPPTTQPPQTLPPPAQKIGFESRPVEYDGKHLDTQLAVVAPTGTELVVEFSMLGAQQENHMQIGGDNWDCGETATGGFECVPVDPAQTLGDLRVRANFDKKAPVHAVIAELASTSDVDGEATDNHWAWQQANTVP